MQVFEEDLSWETSKEVKEADWGREAGQARLALRQSPAEGDVSLIALRNSEIC